MFQMISFVIRTLNEGAYLERTLREISTQATNVAVEVIIVDSGSTDNTLDIARKYGAKIVHISKENWSWGRSLNLGIENAQGDAVGIISGHCYLASNTFIDTALEHLKSYDAIYGRQLPLPRMDPFEEFELSCWYPEERLIDINADLLVGVSNACCVMRKSAWEQLRFDEDAQSMEDGIWAYNALSRHLKLAYTSEIAVYHSHQFAPDHIYRRWYARTLEGIRFGALIYENDRFYQFKQQVKKNFLLPMVVLKYAFEMKRLAGFKSDDASMGLRASHLFLLLKYTAIYNANKDFARSTQKRYWECRQPAWIDRHVRELDGLVMGYVGVSAR